MSRTLSKKKVVLLMVPPWGLDTPPLGLAYISSYLRLHGCQVSVIDGCKDLYLECEKKLRYLWNFDQKDLWNDVNSYQTIKNRIGHHFDSLVERVIDENPSLVGFSVNQNNRLAVKGYCTPPSWENRGPYSRGGWLRHFQHFRKTDLRPPEPF